jgi:hypothetical protein
MYVRNVKLKKDMQKAYSSNYIDIFWKTLCVTDEQMHFYYVFFLVPWTNERRAEDGLGLGKPTKRELE